jgi:hypothetical protein
MLPELLPVGLELPCRRNNQGRGISNGREFVEDPMGRTRQEAHIYIYGNPGER